MCGLTGMMDTSMSGFMQKDLDLFKGLLYINSLRGNSSTGLFGVNNHQQADVYKVLGTPYKLFEWGLGHEFLDRMLKKYWAVFGHGRFPTIGETSIKNAHPFEHRHITLMHNGTIKNHEKLNEKYKKDFAVDSELICWMVSEIGIKETIKEIDGAYALIYFDSKEDAVNIVRNYERPLWIGKNSFNDRAVFGSEKHYQKWADEKGPMINEIKEVPTNTLLTIRKVGGKLDIQQSECYKHTNTTKWKGGYGGYYDEEYSTPYVPKYVPPSSIDRKTTEHKPPHTTSKFTLNKTIVCQNEELKFRVRKVTSVKVLGEEPISIIEGLHEDTDMIVVHAECTIQSDVIETLLKKANDEIYMRGLVESIHVMNTGSDVSARIMMKNAILADETVDKSTGEVHQLHPASAILRSGELLSKVRFQELAKEGCFICDKPVSFIDATKCSLISDEKYSKPFIVCGSCHEPKKETSSEFQNLMH